MTDPQAIISLASEDRFDRLRRIEWWDQDRLREARVLVIGAGALGNEILKNLALLGIGHIFIADQDTIETSNLSRSVLFRERNAGRSKAAVAAEAVVDLYPSVCVDSFHGDVIFDLGLGVFRWADVVIAGVDNREARLHVNRACYRVGRPLVDAATEVLRGVVRVFIPPEGACYECTMSAADWGALRERRGCAGLRAGSRSDGRVPTTPITASIIAAIECQEAVKILHGLESLSGRGVVFDGMLNDVYQVSYSRSDECNSHDPFEDVVPLTATASQITGEQLLDHAKVTLDKKAIIEFTHEMLDELECPKCGQSTRLLRPLGSVSERDAACHACGNLRRPKTYTTLTKGSALLRYTLADLGVPLFDIVGVRAGEKKIGFELSADGATVLGRAKVPSLRDGGRIGG